MLNTKYNYYANYLTGAWMYKSRATYTRVNTV